MRKVRAYNLIIGKPVILPENFYIDAASRGVLSLEQYYEDSPSDDFFSYTKHNIGFKVTKSEGKK